MTTANQPVPMPKDRCAQCFHSYSFHGKSFGVTCRAMGCKGGPDQTRCLGFVRVEEPVLSSKV